MRAGDILDKFFLYRKAKSFYFYFFFRRKLKKFKNSHLGERCFVIGNGPSLKIEDLEKIQKNGDVSFASNMIFKCFDDTSWRPYFYCVQDFNLLRNNIKTIEKKTGEYKFGFFPLNLYRAYSSEFLKNKKNNFFEIKDLHWNDGRPKFSFDISECTYEGFTVTYCMIQLAVYMGFKEIYLLGVDHSYGKNNNSYSKILKGSSTFNPPQLDKTTIAYEYADKMAKKAGSKVFNATRGGYLEAFERADFDSLF